MPKAPRLSAKEVIKILKKNGFWFDRQKGSHKIYKRADGQWAVVPFHGSKILHPGILKIIFKDTGIDLFDI